MGLLIVMVALIIAAVPLSIFLGNTLDIYLGIKKE